MNSDGTPAKKIGRPLGAKTRRRVVEDMEQTGENIGREDVEVGEDDAATLTQIAVEGIVSRPEIAKLFMRGATDAEIAARIGCSVKAVRDVRTLQAPRLPDRLSALTNRIVSHIESRSLEDENLRDLMNVAALAIEKERLIRGEATQRTEIYGTGAAESLEVALFGVKRPGHREVRVGEGESAGAGGAGEGDVEDESRLLPGQSGGAEES